MNLKIEFKNKNLLKQALVHRSYLNEHPDFELGHNERLEFLGDAVLELIVTEHLYNNYNKPEGDMTSWRAALVNTKMLAKVARKLEIENDILLSQGEQQSMSNTRSSILANVLEAIIGALYLDQGYNVAKKFICDNILIELKEILDKGLFVDAKSKFQELAQEKFNTTPHYGVLSESGPDHDKVFEVAVYLGDKIVAKGKGSSKQAAQEGAAKKGLDIKFKTKS